MSHNAATMLQTTSYVEDYLDCIESLPNDLQRSVSQIREIDNAYQGEYVQRDKRRGSYGRSEGSDLVTVPRCVWCVKRVIDGDACHEYILYFVRSSLKLWIANRCRNVWLRHLFYGFFNTYKLENVWKYVGLAGGIKPFYMIDNMIESWQSLTMQSNLQILHTCSIAYPCSRHHNVWPTIALSNHS